MKIGILQTGHSPEGLFADFGTYGDMFARMLDGHGFNFQVWNVVDGIFPEDTTDADGWLITGSKHGAYEAHDWIPPLEEFLHKAYEQAIPIVGICFGHQILAQALGGKVVKSDGGWSVGAIKYDTVNSDQDVTLYAWHQDQVVERPADANVLGSSPFCENAMLVYGDKALTIQAHPEFSSAFIKGLAEQRGRGVVPDEILEQAVKTLDDEVSQDWAIDKVVRFFKQPRV